MIVEIHAPTAGRLMFEFEVTFARFFTSAMVEAVELSMALNSAMCMVD